LALLAVAIVIAAAWMLVQFLRTQAEWSMEERRQLRRSLSAGQSALLAALLLVGVAILVSGLVLGMHGAVTVDLFVMALGLVALVTSYYLTKLFSHRPPPSRS